MGILLGTTDRTDGNEEAVEDWEGNARLMAHPIGKAVDAETFVERDPEDEKIRHEQGPIVIGNKHAGTLWDPLQTLYDGSEIIPEEGLEEPSKPMNHLGVAVLEAIDFSGLYESLHAYDDSP